MKKILAVLISIFALTACTQDVPVSNELEADKVEEKVTTIVKNENVKDISNFELLGRHTVDIEGIEETCVSLYTSAQRDRTGELMWDDTQEWVLEAATADGSYILFDERINGQAYMKVLRSYNDNSEDLLINLHIYANTYNEIREYRFNNGVFEERRLFTTDDRSTQGISELYSSIPDYE